MQSRELEKLVVRIHRLLEPESVSVTWNHRIRDPDTGQLRQIDGLIARKGTCIHLECRAHNAVQDVTWVEELIGRRESMRVDGIIAVSLSGFTGPAIKKAEKFGVILRTFAEMTDAEIRAWGKTAKFSVDYIQFSSIELTLFVDTGGSKFVSEKPFLNIVGSKVSPIYLILGDIVKRTADDFVPDRTLTVDATLTLSGLRLDAAAVRKTRVQLRGHLRRELVNVVAVKNYGGIEPITSDDAIVTNYEVGETEIIQVDDKCSLMIDFSKIDSKVNCFFCRVSIDFGRDVTMRKPVLNPPSNVRFKTNVLKKFRVIELD